MGRLKKPNTLPEDRMNCSKTRTSTWVAASPRPVTAAHAEKISYTLESGLLHQLTHDRDSRSDESLDSVDLLPEKCCTPRKSDDCCKDSGYASSLKSAESSTPKSSPTRSPPRSFPSVTEISVKRRRLSKQPVKAIILDCQWQECPTPILPDGASLLEHILIEHVEPQAKTRGRSRPLGVCQWEECRHADMPGSLSWLRYHATSHAGVKPFPCLLRGCSERFHTSSAVHKHAATAHCFAGEDKLPRSRSSSQNQHDRDVRVHVPQESSAEAEPLDDAGTSLIKPYDYESQDQLEQISRCNVFKGGIEEDTIDDRTRSRLQSSFYLQLCARRGGKLPRHLLPRVDCRRTLKDGSVQLLCSFAHLGMPEEWIPISRCKQMGIKGPYIYSV